MATQTSPSQAEAEAQSPGVAPKLAPNLWSPDQFDHGTESVGFLQNLHRRLVGLFVVPSSSGTNLAYLDGLRGVAVILVVLFHCWVLGGNPWVMQQLPFLAEPTPLKLFFSTGYVGVDLFFILSGFLLSQSWIRADYEGRPRPEARRFFRHRIFRIVPAYYTCLLFMLVLLVPTLIAADFVYNSTGAFILGAHLLFLHFIFPISSSSYNINGALWTMTIEAMFYLILPWAVTLFFRRRWMVALPACVVIALTWSYLSIHSFGGLVHLMQQSVAKFALPELQIRDLLSQQFPSQIVSFAVGMTLANIVIRRQALPGSRVMAFLTHPWMGKIYFLLGLSIVGATMVQMNYITVEDTLRYYLLSKVTIAFGFVFVLAGLLFGGNLLQALFGFTPLRLVGIVGFSAYLWHMPLIYLVDKFPLTPLLYPEDRFPYVVRHVAVLLLLVSCFSYLLVEKPFLLMGRKRKIAATDPATVAPVS